MKKIIPLFLSLALIAPAAHASEGAVKLPQLEWSFKGPFGTFDRASAQRGFQVYKEVCAACHSLHQKSYRNLMDLGFSDAEVKAIAASYTVKDGPNDEGEMFDRPGRPSDRFVSPYANKKAAQAANGGAYPPDLSLIVKARHDGANYVHALLNGYEEQPPAGFTVPTGMNYNKYFAGHLIAMPKPLSDGQVTYADGTQATVSQMAHDVTTFLAWAAEPELEERNRTGARVMIFLLILTGLFYMSYKKVWRNVKKN